MTDKLTELLKRADEKWGASDSENMKRYDVMAAEIKEGGHGDHPFQIYGSIMDCHDDIVSDLAAAIRSLQAKLDAVRPRPIEEAPRDTACLCFTNGPSMGHFNTALGKWVDNWNHRPLGHFTHFIPLSALAALEQKP